jgi:hypothetical protein
MSTIIIDAEDPRVVALAERLGRMALRGGVIDAEEASIRAEIESLSVPIPSVHADFARAYGHTVSIDYAAQPSYTPPVHPLDRPCPTCHAAPGSRCTGRTGRPRDVHGERKAP